MEDDAEQLRHAEAIASLVARIEGGYLKTLGRSAEYIAERVIACLWDDGYEVVRHVHRTFEVEKRGSPVRTFLCRHPLCSYTSTKDYELDDRLRITLLEEVSRTAVLYRDTPIEGRKRALDEALAAIGK
jgi:hypothetical protein